MIELLQGDCLTMLPTLVTGSVQCIVTSPPYFGLRAYSDDPREIGRERIPDCLAWARREPPCGACYVCALRAVFAQLWRVLRDDGTCWLNLGDSFSSNGGAEPAQTMWQVDGASNTQNAGKPRIAVAGIPDKNLLMIPARVALALQADGWIVRSDVIWSKPNCMPESVTDRPTRAHEYVFLLAKQARYFYDAQAIREEGAPVDWSRVGKNGWQSKLARRETQSGNGLSTKKHGDESAPMGGDGTTRNRRTVWTIATQPVKLAHFATMPEALIEPCILAGSSAQACEHCGAAWGRVVERELTGVNEIRPDRDLPDGKMPQKRRAGDSAVSTLGFAPRCACPDNTGAAASVVLDPFGGSGTVGRVAQRFQRSAIGIDLSHEYIALQEQRTNGVQIEMVDLF